ncbi:hypothetical protein [Elizabethkingia ursingii]|uniref:Fibrobacter succinogenes major paralogous domain-containing protein n=1 Tax=Elizabethkingia ursingii TaxID=1756150 RepID=A0ABX3ND37_9FLAO|nr:hypothetical protein [Elizabethkingia ursingii]OPB94414.1 hypothetical protein BB021_17560 [Elizabethkingia ursingii]
MKTNVLYKYLYFCSGIVLISGNLILTGCSTETTRSEENILTEEKVAVTFSIGGITDEEVTTSDSDPNTLLASAKPLTAIFKSKTTGTGDLDVVTTLETGPIEASQAITKNALAATGITPYAATKPMDQDKTFRVLVYNSNNQFVGSIDQIVKGTAVTLDLVKGGSYKWYAFSFNDTNPLPAINPATLQVPVANKDLLYAQSIGTFTANAGDNHQVITFNHAMAKINITIDARYVPASIGAVNVGFNSNTTYIKQGNFDLRAQSFTTTSSYTTGATDFQFTDTNSNSTGSFVKNTVLYTAPDGAAINSGDFTVKINSIVLDDFSGNTLTVTNNNPSYGSVTPLRGNGYNFRITIQKGGLVGGTIWAAGNLYYDPTTTDPNKKYKIRPDDTTSRNANSYWDTDYWPWGGITPTQSVGFGTLPAYDPCKNVFPQNTWRMPTETEMDAINTLTTKQKVANGTRYQASNGKWIQFNWDGYINRPISGDFIISRGTRGLYWSSSLFGNTLPVFYDTTDFGTSFGWNSGHSDTYQNIRCVRTR